MRSGLRILLTLLLVFSVVNTVFSESSKYSTFAKVQVAINNGAELNRIAALGIDLENFNGKFGPAVELYLNYNEIDILKENNISYEIVIPDMAEYYSSRIPDDPLEIARTFETMRKDGIENYALGSMGGFHTRDEHVAIYNYLHNQYPNLMSPLILIGTSHLGVNIYAVRISDNPNVQEENEGNVYFDGLIHAREPMSSEVLMYYTYWLLENYGTDPEATYLINNRQIYIVPVMNPDGYKYNEANSPSGGGMWRKNRRNNSDSDGVDLNRNYGYQWGYDNIGSSSVPSSETYRGPSAFSEPETQATRDFILSVNPSIGFNTHTYAGRFINPYGYNGSVVDFEYYSQLAGDFGTFVKYLYGTSPDMISYTSNGTARDWMHHDAGCLTWVPEIGETGFWPSQSEIIPMNSDFLPVLKYLTWVSGAYARLNEYIVNTNNVAPGDSLEILTIVKNKGLSLDAKNVEVSITSLNSLAVNGRTSTMIDSIESWDEASSYVPSSFYVSSSASLMDQLRFKVLVKQEGLVTDRDTIKVYVGKRNVLFSDKGENGKANWTSSGSGYSWDTTFVDYFSQWHSFTDSRYGNHNSGSNNYLTMNSSVSLAGTMNPRVEFLTRYALEHNYDYVRFEISLNGGSTWSTLSGDYTRNVSGQPSYTGVKKGWVKESIDLTNFTGQNVKFRFRLSSDSGVNGDGFYFDDFSVVDYTAPVTSVATASKQPETFSLQQNYPNPFNPQTEIRYSLAERSDLKITIYNSLGQKIKTLVDSDQPAGSGKVTWTGVNEQGAAVSAGIYYIKMEAVGGQNNFRNVKKCLLVK